MKAKIGLGLITYNRPAYFKRAIKSVLKHLPMLDHIVVVDDGSAEDYVSDYQGKAHIIRKENGGVATAKNAALQYLMDQDCHFLFIMEDDVEITDPTAVIGYLAAHKMTGIPHFNFAHHGDNTRMDSVMPTDGQPLLFWPNCVGAYSFYTREAIENVGLMDENFKNAYEHVEHTYRIYKDHIPYGLYPDVIDSQKWIREQPGALDNSSIRDPDGKWQDRIRTALEYWRSKDPDCPAEDPNWDAE